MSWLYCSCAFLVSALACRLLARCAPELRLVDIPDARKCHGVPIPVVGGIGVLLGFLMALLWAGLLRQLDGVVGPMLLLFLIGVIDDACNLSARLKLVLQVLAAWWLVHSTGAELYAIPIPFAEGHINLGVVSVPLAVLMVVSVLNAINMIDGLDGLAGGCITVAAAALGMAAMFVGRADLARIAALLCAAVLGFLLWNARFPWQARARVFMGDAGALSMGLMLCWLVLRLSLTYVPNPEERVPLTVVLAPLAVPVIDMIVVAFWRLAEGHNPMKADRGHSHHLLLAMGMSQVKAVRIIWVMAILITGVTFLAWRLGVQEGRLLGVLTVGALIHLVWFRLSWLALRKAHR